MRKNNLSEKFVQVYNELDDYMRKNLRADVYVDHSTLLRQMADKNRIFQDFYKDLKMFADMRNLLVHNPYKGNADPILVPHKYIVEKYEDIKNQVLYPKKALAIAIPANLIYTTTLDDNALEVMRTMNEKVYTHVPVLENKKMAGVFSENTILSYLSHHKEALILKDMKIGEFSEFIPIDKHLSETFEFVNRHALLIEVEELFRKNLAQRRRIGMVFITNSGKKDEDLLGIITSWDIAGKEI